MRLTTHAAEAPGARSARPVVGVLFTLGVALLLPSAAGAMPAPGDADPADPTVSSNTGAASQRIPIDVPPGPGGFAPRLALTYSSHAGDGPFGIGWRLQLGEIRCTTTQRGVPDFAAQPFVCPRYELDGQLLTYNGGPGENRWHTFIESFREIKYLSETLGWTVKSPDGTIQRYGGTANSRIQAGSVTARWLLSQLEDAFGNQIDIIYSDTPVTTPTAAADLNAAYPTNITYASGDRAIHFEYEPRPDPLHDFAGGIERKITRRVKEIQVQSDNQLVRKWTFGYAIDGVGYSTARSRLSWAQLVGPDGENPLPSTLPRQEFRYTDHGLTGSQWGGDDPAWHLDHLGLGQVQLADVNGDGLVDKVRAPELQAYCPPGPCENGHAFQGVGGMVWLNTSEGWAQSPEWTEAVNRSLGSGARLRARLAYPDAAEQIGTTLHQASLGVVDASVVIDPPDGARVVADEYWSAQAIPKHVAHSNSAYNLLTNPNPPPGSPPAPPTVEGEVWVQGHGLRVVISTPMASPIWSTRSR